MYIKSSNHFSEECTLVMDGWRIFSGQNNAMLNHSTCSLGWRKSRNHNSSKRLQHTKQSFGGSTIIIEITTSSGWRNGRSNILALLRDHCRLAWTLLVTVSQLGWLPFYVLVFTLYVFECKVILFLLNEISDPYQIFHSKEKENEFNLILIIDGI